MANISATKTRPLPLRMLTTPPTSPTSKEAPPSGFVRASGAITPPETPSPLASRPIAQNERRDQSHESVSMPRHMIRDGLLEFDAEQGDYVVLKDKKLGAGRFSQVFLAERAEPRSPHMTDSLTPPTTPTKSRRSRADSLRSLEVYAVKIAADKPSLKAMRNEARIFTHMCIHPESQQYIVPFHGFDPRQNSLVFTALPATLADLISTELESLRPNERSIQLSMILPHVARSLIGGLAWMHSIDVVHADIKPPNILLRPDHSMSGAAMRSHPLLGMPFTAVFADFTSSFLVTDDPKKVSSSGGGTYDYMAPEQLAPPFPLPDFKMDVYALAVSLTELVTGRSPFLDAGSSRHMKMAMIKEGKALDWAMRDTTGEARLIAVDEALLKRAGCRLRYALEAGLRKNTAERPDARQWIELW